MPVNLSIKNVPDALAERLRLRAEHNHRSLQRELMSILEHAAKEPGSLAPDTPISESGRLSIEQLADRARKLFPKGTPSSVEFIRQQRDGRFGAAWVRTGRHTAK